MFLLAAAGSTSVASAGSTSVASAACADSHENCVAQAMLGNCASIEFGKTCPLSCQLCRSNDCFDASDECAARIRTEYDCYTPGMATECAWSCIACRLSTEVHCARPRSVLPAVAAGGVDSTFREIVATHAPNVAVLSREPWVVTIDDFLSNAEVDGLLAAVGTRNLASSDPALEVSPEEGVCPNTPHDELVGGVGANINDGRRSSTSAWCDSPECQQDEVIQRIRRRAETLLRVPMANAEYLQVLRYEKGGRYIAHHDQMTPRAAPAGPRVLTLFLYLSDGFEGGETRFPTLNITATPKLGRALLWPNVMDGNPFVRDHRTVHEALTVTRGVKLAANYWLHAFPYAMYAKRGCGNRPSLHNWYLASDFYDSHDPFLGAILEELDELDTLRADATTTSEAHRLPARLEAALKQVEAELHERNATFGPRHPATLKCQFTLASLFGLRDRPSSRKAALALHGATLAIRRRVLGDDHEETLASQSSLGWLLCQDSNGRVDVGESLLREALAAYSASLGHEHRTTQRLQRWLQQCSERT